VNHHTYRTPSQQTICRAKALRREATTPERLLWWCLRRRLPGRPKFRRQHPIEPYVVDFYCAEARLAVELDGESHDGRGAYDAQRTQLLRERGVSVLRVSNDDVIDDVEMVAAGIFRIAEMNRVEREMLLHGNNGRESNGS
jgi:very-short-patch-repair endonuclease